MKKRLVTSALPYVNNIPHLGNLIQVLSADAFSRFCKQYGYETLYICGTDEYGTATETKALEEGISPNELCSRYFKIHSKIYQWFNIDFDKFGRSSTPEHTEIVQSIFQSVYDNGLISEQKIVQPYCNHCQRFLADRYVSGRCPHCDYEKARGDQCEDCGKLLDPSELIEPKCGICGSAPKKRESSHLFLNLPAIKEKLEEWVEHASEKGFWSHNAIQMTKSWIRDGLKERCITRDLKWGVKVPVERFKDKVFYVWFDAPIGYISITSTLTKEWKDWWKSPDNVELFQFIGKDNIPFHTVIFPSSLLATEDNWTLLHHISSTEYLNYESGKFSKSLGVGIFGTDCIESGFPADFWRFYIFYNRPERSDYTFSWDDFYARINADLIGNLANLVNRTFSFLGRFYDNKIPDAPIDKEIIKFVREKEKEITETLDRSELRAGLRAILDLSSYGNKIFQESEPWKNIEQERESISSLLVSLLYLVKDIAIMIRPYIPETSDKIGAMLGITDFSWSHLGEWHGLKEVKKAEVLFKKPDKKYINELKARFSGSQSSTHEPDSDTPESRFREDVCLKSALVEVVQKHPNADKLYVITLNCGENEPRTIVSGLVDHYEPDELKGMTIALVANLKPTKFRGVLSNGMLLAAEDESGLLEVLSVEAEPGTSITLEGDSPESYPSADKKIKPDRFFSIPIEATDGVVSVGSTPLTTSHKERVKTERVKNGKVG